MMYGSVFTAINKKSYLGVDCTEVVIKMIVGNKGMCNKSKIDSYMAIRNIVMGDGGMGDTIVRMKGYSNTRLSVIDD